MLPQTDVARRGVVLVVATLLSFLFLVPTALAVSASVAAASTVPGAGPPVLSLSHTPEAHALSDAMNVNISMEENAGLDVIVNSTAGVSAPGVPSATAVRFHQTGTDLGGRHRSRVAPAPGIRC